LGVAAFSPNSSQRASLAATRAARVPIEIQLDGFVGFLMQPMMESRVVQVRQLFVRNRKPKMAAVVEARAILCAIPLDLSRGESKGVWLQRASRFLGISPSEGTKLYYRRKARMDADKLAAMRERYNELQEGAAKRQELHDELKARTAILRSSHGSEDPRGSSRGTSPAGKRSDGKMAGCFGESRGNAAARSDRT
jgi:hypothetical protein